MYDVDLVWQLVADVLRSGIIDEADLAREVTPFMAAVVRIGLSWETAPGATLETYRPARRAVDQLAAERAKKLRAPAREWAPADLETVVDLRMMRAMFPGRRASPR